MLSQAFAKNDLAEIARLLSSPPMRIATVSDVVEERYDDEYILDADILRIKVAPRWASRLVIHEMPKGPRHRNGQGLIVCREVRWQASIYL